MAVRPILAPRQVPDDSVSPPILLRQFAPLVPSALARYFAMTATLQGANYVFEFGFNNLRASSAPTVTDDSFVGYAPGSVWVWRSEGRVWICSDNTAGAAVWKELTIGGGTVTGTNTGDQTATTTDYTPTTGTDWDGADPTTALGALNRCATLLKALNGGTGP